MAKKSGKAATKTKAASAAKKSAKGPARVKWMDDKSGAPLIEKYARNLASFLDAVADGEVTDAEVKGQEERLVKLMKEVEPNLDDGMHAKVTQLLCELTAYDLMQVLNAMQNARPRTVFRG
jgi:hypothetical protein